MTQLSLYHDYDAMIAHDDHKNVQHTQVSHNLFNLTYALLTSAHVSMASLTCCHTCMVVCMGMKLWLVIISM